MALETGTYISDLVSANPVNTDTLDKADDHLRLIKATVKATFPNIAGAVTPTHTELNFVDGVTSAIQTQLDAKAPLASPTLTGVPLAPTAAVDTSTTQLATTAYVVNQGYLKSSTAASTYLTQANAASTYSTPASVSSALGPYLTSATAAATYSTPASVSSALAPYATTAYVNGQIAGVASATTANVLAATAGATAGVVGSYALMRWTSLGSNQNPDATVAGSNLNYTNVAATATGITATGTWRLMGFVNTSNPASVFLRIS